MPGVLDAGSAARSRPFRRPGRRRRGDRAGHPYPAARGRGWRPAPPRPRSSSTSSTASTSTASWTGPARSSPPSWVSPNRPSRACWRSSGVAGHPGSARPASASACSCSLTPSTWTTTGLRLARAVIAEHLPALARGHFTSIAARARGVTRPDPAGPRPDPAAAAAVSGVRRQRAGGHRYVVPDVVVRAHDEIAGAFTVELVEPAMTRLGVRPRTAKAGTPAPTPRRRRSRGPGRSSPSSTTGGTRCGGSPSTPSSGSGSSWSPGRRRCGR